VDHERLLYGCAGINHIAWMTPLEVEGEDAYPLLFAALDDPGVYAKDRVRFELMRRFRVLCHRVERAQRRVHPVLSPG
jgi:alpha-galactosidase